MTETNNPPRRPSALVVLSGGQDSTTCLFWAKQYFDAVHAISFNYGQRHDIELQSAAAVAWLAQCKSHQIIDVPDILGGASPLTNHNESLELYEDHDSMAEIIGDRVEKTFVPMRNALFLTIAANRAVCLGINHLVTGVCQAGNANYPDCRQQFISAQQHTIQEALGVPGGFQIHAPLMYLSKAESITLAKSIPGAYTALAFTHTAYDGTYPPVSKDHASVLRAYGFEQAGVPDPLVIRAAREGLMPLPTTANYGNPDANAILADDIMGLAGTVDRYFFRLSKEPNQ